MIFKVKVFIPSIILIFLILSEVFMYKVDILRYSDEICAVGFLCYLMFKFVKSSFKSTKELTKIIGCCFLLLLIGIISNLVYSVQLNIVAILLDIVANFKLVVICVGFYNLLTPEASDEILKKSLPIAKIFVTLGIFFGILSLFFDIGMRGQFRFGIWGFNYIFKYAHIYALMLFSALLIISKNGEKDLTKYILMIVIQLILTTKGTSIVSAVVMLILLFLRSKGIKAKRLTIPLIIISSVLLGGYQIRTYFLKDSPRLTFLKYGIITANDYAPIGSGFATFGSDMAGKYYSNLYYKYGFNYMYGMSHDQNLFLNDNYWPSIMGQFGYIGLIIALYALYLFYKIISKKQINTTLKSLILSSLFYMALASLGTTIFTTSATIILCVIIVIICKTYKTTEVNNEC